MGIVGLREGLGRPVGCWVEHVDSVERDVEHDSMTYVSLLCDITPQDLIRSIRQPELLG